MEYCRPPAQPSKLVLDLLQKTLWKHWKAASAAFKFDIGPLTKILLEPLEVASVAFNTNVEFVGRIFVEHWKAAAQPAKWVLDFAAQPLWNIGPLVLEFQRKSCWNPGRVLAQPSGLMLGF